MFEAGYRGGAERRREARATGPAGGAGLAATASDNDTADGDRGGEGSKGADVAERITVFGAGYVGLVTGACLASAGHIVRVAEVDRSKLELLASGKLPFYEPQLDAIVAEAVERGRLSFLHPDDLGAGADPFCFVAVGTPSTNIGAADLRFVRAVVDTIAELGEAGTVVVMKSTVPPGTGRDIADALGQASIGYVSNPEFLREGNAVEDWFQTDRIVLGGQSDVVARVAALYDNIDAPIVRCDVSSAELVKYASNAFLATKISFTNEIAALCDLVGADISVVSSAVGLDKRIGGAFLNAGIGYGGSCFPKDTRALDFLSMVNGHDFHLLKAVITVNARQRLLPVIALKKRFGSLAGLKVAVLGLTFKPNTNDVREAPAADIIEQLVVGGAEVTAFDPIAADAQHESYRQTASLEDALRGANAVVLATEWPTFVTADWAALVGLMASPAYVFDGRNCLDPTAIRAAGAEYVGIGRA